MMEAALLILLGLIIVAVVNFLGLKEICKAIRESKK